MLNADLHCHSTFSDGTLTPQALAQRAKAHGVELWALTDHDDIGGQHHAMQAAHALGLPYLCGVEISVSFAGVTVHIVGLGIDIEHQALVQGLHATRSGREQRARAMSQSLERAGIAGAYEGAAKYVGNPELISRTHFARYLVELGICRDMGEVFRHYLNEGKPGFVPHQWASLEQAVRWITGSGGIAVVAHPGRYKFSVPQEHALFTEFKKHGGKGVEVITTSHSAADATKYARYCRDFGLLASRGSDFHSPQDSHTELGQLAPLPEGITAVWELLRTRIH